MHGADLKEWEHASLSKLLLPGVAELVEHVVPPTPDLSLGLQEVSSKWNEHKRSSSINRWKDMISEAHRWTSRRKKKLVFDSQDMFIRLQSRFECRLQLARKKMWITRFSMDYRPVRDFEVLTNMTPPADYCVSLPELSTFLLFFTSSNDFVKFHDQKPKLLYRLLLSNCVSFHASNGSTLCFFVTMTRLSQLSRNMTVIHNNNNYYGENGTILACGMSLSDWQAQGEDINSTVSVYPLAMIR